MQKVLKNSKQIMAFVFAIAIIAVSLFTGSVSVTVDACDLTKIDYWDGTMATSFAGGDGSAAKPYIIQTAEQLAFCCLGQTPSTSGAKYYKVDDSVKTFVMQPEDVVDLDTLLSFDSPDGVYAYLTTLDGVKNWMSVFNRQSFNGNFDGNGATVYGLYATSEGTEDKDGKIVDDVGLFPQYDGGAKKGIITQTNTCKNIAVKNSYFYSHRRLGGIVGAAYLTGYGAKIDGRITIDSCAVVNCYMTSVGSWSYYSEQGIVACGGLTDIITMQNIFVKDVYAYNTESMANINILGNGSSAKHKTTGLFQNTLSDSIILGTAPYAVGRYQENIHQPYAYTNVVTDFPSGEVDLPTPTLGTPTTKKNYTDRIFSVTATGAEFKAAATMLDWDKTWFMGENGPELRVFHDGLELTTTETTHLWKCSCCGLESFGGVVDHTFVLMGDEVKGDGTDVYMCSECGYICQHSDQTIPEYEPGDCVSRPGVYSRCGVCGWYFATELSDAPGHKFDEKVEANIGDCETLGNIEYYKCSVCENRFTTDDTFAPMNTALSDEAISTGYGPHTKECDENGEAIILYDENGHWYKCAVNGGRLDFDSNDLGANGVVKHKFKKSVCIDCGYECTTHIYEPTGKIAVAHSCDTDERSEIKCTRCGYKTSVVTKVASHTIIKQEKVLPTDREEGTKEHYKCDVCKEIYIDAEGTTVAENATLVIPKVLSEEYLKQIGADFGGTSPSTNDALGSVFAVAALAGAAFVMTRKVK